MREAISFNSFGPFIRILEKGLIFKVHNLDDHCRVNAEWYTTICLPNVIKKVLKNEQEDVLFFITSSYSLNLVPCILYSLFQSAQIEI